MNIDYSVQNSIYRTGRIASRLRLDRARLTVAIIRVVTVSVVVVVVAVSALLINLNRQRQLCDSSSNGALQRALHNLQLDFLPYRMLVIKDASLQ
jgi:Mg2+/citrate symporter